MDLLELTQIEYAMENFVNKKIQKLQNISLTDIISDPTLLLLFRKFIQRGQSIERLRFYLTDFYFAEEF